MVQEYMVLEHQYRYAGTNNLLWDKKVGFLGRQDEISFKHGMDSKGVLTVFNEQVRS